MGFSVAGNPTGGRIPLCSSPFRSRSVPIPSAAVFPSSAGAGASCRLRARCVQEDGCVPTASEEKERKLFDDEIMNADKDSSRPRSSGQPDLNSEQLEHNTTSLVQFVVFWILAAVIFGVVLGIKEGPDKATEFFAGYLLEKSLSVDNLFVFILIFKYFKVPTMYQGRVLSYGIAGAVIFRALMIVLGSATLQRFEAVNIVLAIILLYSAYKLFFVEDDEGDLSDNFIVKTCQKFIPVTFVFLYWWYLLVLPLANKFCVLFVPFLTAYYDNDRFFTIADGVRKATPLLVTVVVLELSDVAFAIDSIPAVFGVTRDPFIVFSSNIFAILGLRSIYRLISERMTELDYLQPAIGVVLGFIGSKMLLDFFGYHISTEVSLGVVATSLGTGLLLSLTKKSDHSD